MHDTAQYCKLTYAYHVTAGRAQSVERLATGWTDQGSNPVGWGGGGRYFLHISRPALWPTQPPVQWVPDIYRGERSRGLGVDHPIPSSAVVKERVGLYLQSPVWTFVACLRMSFTFSYLHLLRLTVYIIITCKQMTRSVSKSFTLNATFDSDYSHN